MIRLLWALSVRTRYFLRRYMPTNILLDRIRTRQGLKWGVPAMLVAVPYLLAVSICTNLIADGAPGWLNLLVILFSWNAIKFIIMGPVSLVLLIRARVHERVEHRRMRQESDAREAAGYAAIGVKALAGLPAVPPTCCWFVDAACLPDWKSDRITPKSPRQRIQGSQRHPQAQKNQGNGRFDRLHTEEVVGSSPASPTTKPRVAPAPPGRTGAAQSIHRPARQPRAHPYRRRSASATTSKRSRSSVAASRRMPSWCTRYTWSMSTHDGRPFESHGPGPIDR